MQMKSISVKYCKTQTAKGVNSGEILWNFNQNEGWDFNYQQYKQGMQINRWNTKNRKQNLKDKKLGNKENIEVDITGRANR